MAGLCYVLRPGPWQGSASQGSILPAPQPRHAEAAGGLSTHLAPPAPAGAQAGAAQGHRHMPGRAETPGPSAMPGHSQAG